jgi:hypothetical protein
VVHAYTPHVHRAQAAYTTTLKDGEGTNNADAKAAAVACICLVATGNVIR